MAFKTALFYQPLRHFLSLSLFVSINYNHFPTRRIIIYVTAFVILLAGQIGILIHPKTVSHYGMQELAPIKNVPQGYLGDAAAHLPVERWMRCQIGGGSKNLNKK